MNDDYSIDGILGEIDELQAEMRCLQSEKNIIDTFFVTLLFLVTLTWVHSGGLRRLTHLHYYHYTDIMLVSYMSLVVTH
jgi:hypothetical protein